MKEIGMMAHSSLFSDLVRKHLVVGYWIRRSKPGLIEKYSRLTTLLSVWKVACLAHQPFIPWQAGELVSNRAQSIRVLGWRGRR